MHKPRRPSVRLLYTVLGAIALLAQAACAPSAPQPPQVTQEQPGAPKLRTWPLENEIHVTWEAVPGAVAYNLYWSDDPDVAEDRDNEVKGIKNRRYVHQGLETGRTYYYFVAAVNSAGVEFKAFPPIADIPYKYEVRRFRNFLAVMPRPHDTFDTLAAQFLKDERKGWLIRDFNDLRELTPFKAVLVPLKPYEPGGLTDKGYRTVPVLTYHQITRTRPGKMAVLQTDFELQMAYLRRNRYQVITLQQLVEFLEFKGQVPDKAVVITFDDGWASTYSIALPILRKYDYPATLFLTTGLVGKNKKALTWQQVKALDESGVIDVQCHTHNHPNLAEVGDRDAKAYLNFLVEELEDSKAVLKQRIRKDCEFLAYPYGAANHMVVAMAQRAGYRAAFTVDRGSNPFFVTNYRILRSMIFGDYDLKQFAENLESFSDRVLK